LDKIRRFLLNIKRLNQNIPIQNIESFQTAQVSASVLRLDTLHTIISGNKWYKLKFYIKEAQQQEASTLASFGGPYSNHLVALAYAAKQYGFKSIGYVRSNENEPLTPTLEEAVRYGMNLKRIGRTQFQNIKEELMHQNIFHLDDHSKIYWIDEGGYGTLGAKGAATILDSIHSNENTNSIPPEIIRNSFTHIIAAVGTGTMLAGLIQSAASHQHVIGIPVLKNKGTIENEIKVLLESSYNNNNNSNNNGHQKRFTLLHDFHLGGYAKTTPAQFKFMNQFWEAEKIPTDIVYTGKVFMAVDQLIKNNYFPANSNLLIVHSLSLIHI
jgi:1-aminocyclopropane-1-carboxylate deaminase